VSATSPSVPIASPTASAGSTTAGIDVRTLPRLLAFVGITVLTLYMTVGEGSGWYGWYVSELRIFSIVSIAAVFGGWMLAARRNPAWRPRTMLWPPIVAVLAAFLVASATSALPRIGFEYAAYAVLLAGLYLLLVRLVANPFFGPRLYALAAAICVGICAWYLWTVGGIWVHWWGLVGHVAVPPLRPDLDGLSWGSPNTVAIMAALLLPPALAWFGGVRTRRRIAGLAALTVLVLATVFITGSRGAWLGIAAGSVVTVVVWFLVPGHLAGVRAALGRRRASPVAMVAFGAAVVAGALVALPAVLSRLGAGGVDLRADLATVALRMFQASPLTGVGPGNWVVDRIATTQPTEIDYYIPHAHNIYAQALAEFGVLAVLAAAVVVVWLAALIWSGIRDADQTRRRFGWAALFSTAYFAAHQVADVYIGIPCVLFAFALPIAYLDATAEHSLLRLPFRASAASGTVLRGTARVAGAVAVVSAFVFLAWSESNALAAEQAVAFADDGNWTAAEASATAASSGDPGLPAYTLIAGLTALHDGDPATASADLSKAGAADDLPTTWLDLAAARTSLGDRDGARTALDAAMRLGFQQPAVAFPAGTLYLQLGDRAAAIDALGAALVSGPTLAGDPWFASEPGSDVRAAAIASAEARLTPDQWGNALLLNDTDKARILAGGLTGATRDQALTIVAAYAGDPTARAAVEGHASSSPQDLVWASWAARLARNAGDEAAATRYRSWADTILPGAGDISRDLRVTSGDESDPGYGGVDTSVFGLYTYRRLLPADLLAPTLPHLALH
jgi:O-antigen ligase